HLVSAMCYSPDLDAYVVALTSGQIICYDPNTGAEFASTDAIDLTLARAVFVSGRRVGVIRRDDVWFWDTGTGATYGPFGSADGTTDRGDFAIDDHLPMQNTWTGQIAFGKMVSGKLHLFNFIASCVEEVEDMSAMGSPKQPEFQWSLDGSGNPI